jgi:hypothetical protein
MTETAYQWIREMLLDHMDEMLDEREMELIFLKGHLSPPPCEQKRFQDNDKPSMNAIIEKEEGLYLSDSSCIMCPECKLPMFATETKDVDSEINILCRPCGCCKRQCAFKRLLFNVIGEASLCCGDVAATRRALEHARSDLLVALKEVGNKLNACPYN